MKNWNQRLLRVQEAQTRALFALVYLLILPPFVLLFRLRRSGKNSSWKQEGFDDDFGRM